MLTWFGDPVAGSVLAAYLPRLRVVHKGIVEGRTWSGQLQIIHNSKDAGHVVATSLEEFTEGEPHEIVWEPGNYVEQANTIQRARSAVGNVQFNLFFFNCEDFVNWARSGVPRSEQREAVLGGVLLTALLAVGAGLIAAGLRKS